MISYIEKFIICSFLISYIGVRESGEESIIKKETTTISKIKELGRGKVEVQFKGNYRNAVINKRRLGDRKEGTELLVKKGKPIF